MLRMYITIITAITKKKIEIVYWKCQQKNKNEILKTIEIVIKKTGKNRLKRNRSSKEETKKMEDTNLTI